jgi:hypothetical protein
MLQARFETSGFGERRLCAPEAAVRYPSNDWVKKTCAKREMLVDRRAPADKVEIRQACLPVGQAAPVAPATYHGFVKR